MKKLLVVFVVVCATQSLSAQIGKSSNIGLSLIAQSSVLGLSALPRCSEASACSTIEYIFTGDGLWTEATNWKDGVMPPPLLNSGKVIIISPIVNGECRLNIKQTIADGASLTILPGKRFNVSNTLVFLKN